MKSPANYTPLTPLSLLRHATMVHPDGRAVIYGDRTYTYYQFDRRCRMLASSLISSGVKLGDRIVVIAANTPELLECHFAIPMTGAILIPINIRLDVKTIAFILDDAQPTVVISDREFAAKVNSALIIHQSKAILIEIVDPSSSDGAPLNGKNYEECIKTGNAGFIPLMPDDELATISLLYTSGSSGKPKGCLYHHRGAYLNALGNVITHELKENSVYLWTLPMFHCNGWTFTWAVTAAHGIHVCLRKVDGGRIIDAILKHGVTHLCAAPIVLDMLVRELDNANISMPPRLNCITGGAAPSPDLVTRLENYGITLTHTYGLTETYGPATVCYPQSAWMDDQTGIRYQKMARQGLASLPLGEVSVRNPHSMEEVQRDGTEIGEVMLRGNTIMSGYSNDSQATAQAFQGGWFHSGDLAVQHSDGYIEIKDRAKDIIISGGENISSIEVEHSLLLHPEIDAAAVVAQPDQYWGEVPCAFITCRSEVKLTVNEVIQHCREHLASFKIPKTVVFGNLPVSATGKVLKYRLRKRVEDLINQQ